MDIVDVTYRSYGSFKIALNSDNNHIQKVLRSGQFYETEELERIKHHIPRAESVLDVGANIGNHSIYFAHVLGAKTVCPVEPSPHIILALLASLGLNYSHTFDLRGVGFALSEGVGKGGVYDVFDVNLGASKVTESKTGPVRITTGDLLYPDLSFDLIKLYVEGYELQAIEGLSTHFEKGVKLAFIEVLLTNKEQVIASMAIRGYKLVDEYMRYKRCTNLFFKPA